MNQPNNIITSLITTLRSHHIEPTAEELADALWFAMQIKPFVAPVTTPETKPSQSPLEKSPPSKNLPAPKQPEKLTDSATEIQYQTSESYSLYPHTAQLTESPKIGGRPLRTPAATMLPDALSLEKALRPLMRWVASQTHYVLDEAATVQQIAEQDIWLPVLQGTPERWFEIALVIEDSASMVIWQPTIAEWRRLLERHGAFSNVQTWYLTYQAGQIQLYAGSRPCQPSELLDPLGRRLILVVTDCVAPAWYSGAMTQLLANWGMHNPVAIVQMLPQRLWMGSALGEGSRVNLQATAPGLANARLTVDEDDFWFDDQDQLSGIKIPIITLEADSLRFWARVIMGKGDAWTPGIIFESTAELANPASLAPSPPKNSPSAQQRVEHFYATASPTAQKLAGYLAATPLTLPVMRLVQQVMLPQSRQVHLAEVFLGGLLKRISKEKCDPMLMEYDFHDGVRDLMLDSVLVPEAMEVLKTISKYLEKRLGQPLDFMALLADPTATDGLVIDKENRAFAEIGAKVLSRFGGEYRKLATKIVTEKLPPKTFDFETVTVNEKGEIIHREQKQAQYEIEDLGDGVTLEMVLIPGGTFMMGSPKIEEKRRDREGPQHHVTIQPFWMGKYPITQRQWQAVMGKNPSGFKGENCPVERISWHDMVEFCQRLSEKTGKGYRLPSEAEWEYACRAGTSTPFYFGETITPDLVNYNGNYPYGAAPKGVSRKETTEVGIFPPNAFGLYDMHGNVREWCADSWHEDYNGAPTDGSAWQERGSNSIFVLRSGSWSSYAKWTRAAVRFGVEPTTSLVYLGARLARPIAKTFDFETVTVNEKGKIIHRERKQAQYEIEDLGNGVTLEMVLIPGETFMRGSPENEEKRRDREEPQHHVTIQPFWLGKYPITQRQWQAVMGNNPSSFKGDNRPVEQISWHEVVEFYQRLSEKTGKTYRLPSEAEWEYACRAGTTTPFYFGETITTDLVNYDGNYPYASAPKGIYRGETTEVGIFPPNAFGLYDMHGNVWEWCADLWHDNYDGAPTDGSVWQQGGEEGLFVRRGGSWKYNARGARAAYRSGYVQTNRSGGLGVRLARQ